MLPRSLLRYSATSALLCAACTPDATPPPSQRGPEAPTPKDAATPLGARRALPIGLRDAQGNPLRAQALRDDLRGALKPGGSLGGAALRQFAPFYPVLAQHPPRGAATHYQLALGAEHEPRWFPAEELALFSSLVGALPQGELALFADPELALRAANGEEDLPVLARRAATAAQHPCLWPVLEQRQVGELELWRLRGAARLAAAGGTTAPAVPTPAAYGAEELARADEALRTLDCAIVLDCTGSMRPFWAAASTELRGITRALATIAEGRGIGARFRLVAFRDLGSSFVVRAGAFGDEASFLRELGAQEPDEGGDAPESALEAVLEGLREGWSSSPLATRTLFLVTDAPWHLRDNAEESLVAARLAERDVDLHVLLVGELGGELGAQRDRQARALAQRSGGSTQSLAHAQHAVGALRTTLEQGARRTKIHSQVLSGLREVGCDRTALATYTKLPLEELTEVLDFLGQGLELERFRKHASASGVGVFEAWVAPRRGSELRAELRVLLSRPQLELLRESIRAVISDLSVRDGRRVAVLSWLARTAPDQLCDEQTDLALFLDARLGIPCGPGSALRLSDAEIRHMSEQERLRRLDRVALSLTRIVHCECDARLWFDGGDGVPMAFLPEEVLP